MKKNKINVDLLLKNERSTIDRLDVIIVNALMERFSVTKRIGLIKAENNIETYDSEREETQVKTLEKLIKDSDLDKKFIVNLMKLITTESKKNHEQIKKRNRRVIYEY
jgi:chorismate mutase